MTQRFQRARQAAGTTAATVRTAPPRLLDRLEIVREAEQPKRLERASFNSERGDDGLEVRGCTKREAGMIGQERGPFSRRPLCARNGRGVGHRLHLREPLLAGRSDGEADHHRDDAIEFKGPEGACVHGLNQDGQSGAGDLLV